MGYDRCRFRDEIDSELICPICNNVLLDPVQATCEHHFCRACITERIANDRTCPVDSESIVDGKLQPPQRLLRRMIGRLNIDCENKTNGCNEKVRLETIDRHLLRCEYGPDRKIPCENGCGAIISRRNQKTHSCIQELKGVIQKEVREVRSTLATAMDKDKEREQLEKQMNSMSSEISGLIVELRNTTKKEITGVKTNFEKGLDHERAQSEQLEKRIRQLNSDLSDLKSEMRLSMEKEVEGVWTDVEKQFEKEKARAEDIESDLRELKKLVNQNKTEIEDMLDDATSDLRKDFEKGLEVERQHGQEMEKNIEAINTEIDTVREDIIQRSDDTTAEFKGLRSEMNIMFEKQENRSLDLDDRLEAVNKELAERLAKLSEIHEKDVNQLTADLERESEERLQNEADLDSKIASLSEKLTETKTEIVKNAMQVDEDLKKVQDDFDKAFDVQEGKNVHLQEELDELTSQMTTKTEEITANHEKDRQRLEESVATLKAETEANFENHEKFANSLDESIQALRSDTKAELIKSAETTAETANTVRNEIREINEDLNRAIYAEHKFALEIEEKLETLGAGATSEFAEVEEKRKATLLEMKQDLSKTQSVFEEVFDRHKKREQELEARLESVSTEMTSEFNRVHEAQSSDVSALTQELQNVRQELAEAVAEREKRCDALSESMKEMHETIKSEMSRAAERNQTALNELREDCDASFEMEHEHGKQLDQRIIELSQILEEHADNHQQAKEEFEAKHSSVQGRCDDTDQRISDLSESLAAKITEAREAHEAANRIISAVVESRTAEHRQKESELVDHVQSLYSKSNELGDNLKNLSDVTVQNIQTVAERAHKELTELREDFDATFETEHEHGQQLEKKIGEVSLHLGTSLQELRGDFEAAGEASKNRCQELDSKIQLVAKSVVDSRQEVERNTENNLLSLQNSMQKSFDEHEGQHLIFETRLSDLNKEMRRSQQDLREFAESENQMIRTEFERSLDEEREKARLAKKEIVDMTAQINQLKLDLQRMTETDIQDLRVNLERTNDHGKAQSRELEGKLKDIISQIEVIKPELQTLTESEIDNLRVSVEKSLDHERSQNRMWERQIREMTNEIGELIPELLRSTKSDIQNIQAGFEKSLNAERAHVKELVRQVHTMATEIGHLKSANEELRDRIASPMEKLSLKMIKKHLVPYLRTKDLVHFASTCRNYRSLAYDPDTPLREIEAKLRTHDSLSAFRAFVHYHNTHNIKRCKLQVRTDLPVDFPAMPAVVNLSLVVKNPFTTRLGVTLQQIYARFPNLKVLALALEDNIIREKTPDFETLPQCTLKQLLALELRIMVHGPGRDVSNWVIPSFSDCKHLEAFALYGSRGLTFRDLSVFAKFRNSVKSIDLQFDSKAVDMGDLRPCKNLETFACTTGSLLNFNDLPWSLKTLTVGGLTTNFMTHANPTHHITTLELVLANADLDVISEIMRDIIRVTPHARNLMIDLGYKNVGPYVSQTWLNSLAGLYGSKGMEHLEVLRLYRWANFSGWCLYSGGKVANLFPNLVYLEIRDCPDFDLTSVRKGHNLPNCKVIVAPNLYDDRNVMVI